MSKKILIPTDFGIESLNLLRIYLQNHELKNETIDVVFAHGYSMNDSINDLLFFSKNKTLERLVHQDFEDACHIINNKFASLIKNVRYELFTGYTQASFNNFLEGNSIDLILISKEKKTQKSSGKSFSLIPYIKKSKVEKIELKVPQYERPVEEGNLAELFLAEVSLG